MLSKISTENQGWLKFNFIFLSQVRIMKILIEENIHSAHKIQTVAHFDAKEFIHGFDFK